MEASLYMQVGVVLAPIPTCMEIALHQMTLGLIKSLAAWQF